MHAEDSVRDESRDGEIREDVAEELVDFHVEPHLALVVESIQLVDSRTLVVSSQQEEILWVLDFVGEQQTYHFYLLSASVDVVSEKEVIGFRRKASVVEESEQVLELTVDVSTDFYRSFQFQENRLFLHDSIHFLAQELYLLYVDIASSGFLIVLQ